MSRLASGHDYQGGSQENGAQRYYAERPLPDQDAHGHLAAGSESTSPICTA